MSQSTTSEPLSPQNVTPPLPQKSPMARVRTGVIVALVFLSALALGGWVWALMALVAMAQCFEELRKMLLVREQTASRIAFYSAIIPLTILAQLGKVDWFWPVLMMGFTLSCFQWLFKSPKRTIADLGATLLAMLYTGFLPLHAILIRNFDLQQFATHPFWQQTGVQLLFLIIGVIACSDIGAYYVGKAFGKHLLSPELSPKKTQEGAFGGLIAGLLFGLSVALVINFPLHHAFILSTLLVICGALGDLVESKLKREAGVKDSGGLLAGHGGLLDRLDSYLFSVAVAYYYIHWIVREDGIAKEWASLLSQLLSGH
jgi:phosphatidate cytidylyltransferase